jgi:hypothetical protein
LLLKKETKLLIDDNRELKERERGMSYNGVIAEFVCVCVSKITELKRGEK